jgi:hypothetical protein
VLVLFITRTGERSQALAVPFPPIYDSNVSLARLIGATARKLLDVAQETWLTLADFTTGELRWRSANLEAFSRSV